MPSANFLGAGQSGAVQALRTRLAFRPEQQRAGLIAGTIGQRLLVFKPAGTRTAETRSPLCQPAPATRIDFGPWRTT